MTDVTPVDLIPSLVDSSRPREPRIVAVPGEGIGPSVIDAALLVMHAAASCAGRSISVDVVETATEGRLSEADTTTYQSWFDAGVPVLHGPVGGRFVYQLRSAFDLFVKITPVHPWSELADSALIRPERIAGADVVIIRDNIAGLYQGDFGQRHEGQTAFHEATYQRRDVERLMEVAVRLAEGRQGRLTVVTKPGGLPTISALWRDVAEAVAPHGVSLEFLDIDNACFQMVASPTRFDVVVTPNMMGDVLGDTAAAVLGSRGMAYSANFAQSGGAVFQTAHGAAFDLAGRDVANPIAQVLSLAWLVRSHLGLVEVADLMVTAARQVVAAGSRTADISSPTSRVVGTVEMSELIVERIEEGHST